MNGFERMATAFHEAGHALAAWELGIDDVGEISIAGNEHFQGWMIFESIPIGLNDESHLNVTAQLHLSGPVSEWLFTNNATSSETDFFWNFPEHIDDFRPVNALLQEFSGETLRNLRIALVMRVQAFVEARENWRAIEALANELAAQTVLNWDEVEQIIENSMPDSD